LPESILEHLKSYLVNVEGVCQQDLRNRHMRVVLPYVNIQMQGESGSCNLVRCPGHTKHFMVFEYDIFVERLMIIIPKVLVAE
jgi:hypothetical protein